MGNIIKSLPKEITQFFKGEQFDVSGIPTPTDPARLAVNPILLKLLETIAEKGISLNVAGIGSLIPNVPPAAALPPQQILPPQQGPPVPIDIVPNVPKTPQEFAEPFNVRSRFKQTTIDFPMPQGPKSDPAGWLIMRAKTVNFSRLSAAELAFTEAVIGYNNGRRRASQSTNLNYAAIKKKLAFYASVLEFERTKTININEDLLIKTWKRMVRFARATFDYADFYTGSK